jgi:hypothetical protein
VLILLDASFIRKVWHDLLQKNIDLLLEVILAAYVCTLPTMQLIKKLMDLYKTMMKKRLILDTKDPFLPF